MGHAQAYTEPTVSGCKGRPTILARSYVVDDEAIYSSDAQTIRQTRGRRQRFDGAASVQLEMAGQPLSRCSLQQLGEFAPREQRGVGRKGRHASRFTATVTSGSTDRYNKALQVPVGWLCRCGHQSGCFLSHKGLVGKRYSRPTCLTAPDGCWTTGTRPCLPRWRLLQYTYMLAAGSSGAIGGRCQEAGAPNDSNRCTSTDTRGSVHVGSIGRLAIVFPTSRRIPTVGLAYDKPSSAVRSLSSLSTNTDRPTRMCIIKLPLVSNRS
jgi:hypothetical protein